VFTGIVSAISRVSRVAARTAGSLLVLDRPGEWAAVQAGESVAVSGVCLTALPGPDGSTVAFDVSPETLSRSTLGGLVRGARVNLERALAAGGRFGGHIVAGHVDAMTGVLGVVRAGDFWTFTFGLGSAWERYVVEKGSIALDGVSLTVASLAAGRFDVAVVPHTFTGTTLGDLRPGDRVNVEVDILGKYVERLLAGRLGAPDDARGRDGRLEALLTSP
jgi:riboflavin synthase